MVKLLLFLVCPFAVIYSQVGTGEWRLHVPNRKCTDVVKGNGMIFSAYDKGIVEYDLSSGELSLMTSINSLSDIGISAINYVQSSDALIIGYDNGNVDIYKDRRITNVPAIKLAQIPGSKRINRIIERNGSVFLATDFSVIKLDVTKKEIKETWYPSTGNPKIQDIEIRNDTIFALSPFALYYGLLADPALSDPQQWTLDTRLPLVMNEEYRDIESAGGELFILRSDEPYGGDTLYKLTSSSRVSVFDPSVNIELNSLREQNNQLMVILFDGVQRLNPINGALEVLQGDYYPFGAYPRPNQILIDGNTLWIADNINSLIKKDGNSYEIVRVEGPVKSEFYFMDWNKGRFAIAGGGLSQISSTFSGSGLHIFENEEWKIRDRDNVSSWNGQNIWDFLSVSINPRDVDQIAVSTFSEIPVSIVNLKTLVTDTFTPLNSTLNTSLSNNQSSLVSAVQYDFRGNLWVLNGYSDKPLNVYSADGNWYSFECGTAAKNKFSRKLVLDNDGNKWFSLDGAGIVGYKDNQTISDPSDDDFILLNTGSFSGNLPSERVTALAVDLDNELWIGTDNGFAVLYNTENAFDAEPGDYNASRIKLEYEGNVEYVLGNTGITDIEVDGGNRKWVGTANSGLVLLSPDGLEIIEQFTTDNSPLISNNIIDLEIDQNTGELFIITDLGLLSYRTDATSGDADYSDVQVFPNPVRPGFDGLITIQGIQYNSDVKITDVAGNLIFKTNSNGGTATWNGKTLNGERVPAGVYLIWTAANDGKGRKVGKVLVLNQ